MRTPQDYDGIESEGQAKLSESLREPRKARRKRGRSQEKQSRSREGPSRSRREARQLGKMELASVIS